MWKVIETEDLVTTPFFRLRKDKCELPDGRVMPRYFTFDFPDWAMVVPITTNNKVVMVKQYRHSRQDWFLEFPGGTTDPGQNENPEKAAQRELLEETGYIPGEMISLGAHCPNPALQSNQMHAYLALGCEKKAEQNLDPYEDLSVELYPVEELIKLGQEGKILHSLMLATLFKALPYLQK